MVMWSTLSRCLFARFSPSASFLRFTAPHLDAFDPPSMSAATAQPIPSSSSATSSSDSQSPVLSSSPLDSFSSIHRALPSSNSGSYREREESYDSMADVLASEEEPQRRHSMDDSDDALKQYKQGLYMYTSSRFDRFKDDLERKKRSGSSPNGVQRRSSSQ